MTILTLENVQDLMRETIEYYRDNRPAFSPNDDNRDVALLARLQNPFTDWNQVAAYNRLYSPNFKSTLGSIRPADCFKPGCFQFSQGDSGWYFTYANFGDATITFVVFRLPIVCPAVAKKHGLNMDETCVYMLTGFYNSKTDGYTPIEMVVPANPPPQNGKRYPYCYYKCVGNSRMSIEAVDQNGTKVMWTGSPSLNQMNLKIVTQNNKLNIDISTQSGSQSVWNGDGGCSPVCIAGVGSLYWSYPSLSTKGVVNGKPVSGLGWFDHQWKNSQRPDMWLLRIFENVSQIGSAPKPLMWNWFTIQLPEAEYMLWFGYDKVPEVGRVYKAGFTNKYVQGNRTNVKDSTMTILETMLVDNVNFPTRVRIFVDGKTYTLLNEYKDPCIVRLGKQQNWEGIAAIEERKDGQGFLESNAFQPTNELLNSTATTLDIVDASPFYPRTLTFKEYAPSLFMLIFLILLVLFIVVGIPIIAIRVRKSSLSKK